MQLQGKEFNFVTTKSIIFVFFKKLTYGTRILIIKNSASFLPCRICKKTEKIPLMTQVYYQHFNSLHKNFFERFEDILPLKVRQWIKNLFVDIKIADTHNQE